MAARIAVKKLSAQSYLVEVMEGNSESAHRVTLEDKDYTRLTGGNVTPEELIRRSFEFLLEQESKESILESFDLMVISRYFPQYEREIKKRIVLA
ncbi:MAG TPA: hypothetical protein VN727_01790 [Candidatus Binatia bacterium]|nr:hypothetical protein [Candidatus Binatia bacterium]